MSTEDGIAVWDLTHQTMSFASGEQWEVGPSYTHCFWIKWTEKSNGRWRTLFRGTQDHSILVRAGSNELGMYSNREGHWQGSGFDISPGTWQFVCTVGESDLNPAWKGISKMFVGSLDSAPTFVGRELPYVSSMTKVNKIGWGGQGPGKLAHFSAYNAALTESSLVDLWKRTKPTPRSAKSGYSLTDSGAPTTDLNASQLLSGDGIKAWNLDDQYSSGFLERTSSGKDPHLLLAPSVHNEAARREEWRIIQIWKCELQALIHDVSPDSSLAEQCKKNVDYDHDVGTIDRKLAEYQRLVSPPFTCAEGDVTFSGEEWIVPEGDMPPSSEYTTRAFHPHLALGHGVVPFDFCHIPTEPPPPSELPLDVFGLMKGFFRW